LQTIREQFYLVYATGRSYDSACQLKTEAQLLEPDYWITSVGTAIYHQGQVDNLWAKHLSENWNRDAVTAVTEAFPSLKLQPAGEQNPYKVSFWLTEAAPTSVLKRLERSLHQANLAAQVVFSSGRDIDILPLWGTKGHALTYLLKNLRVHLQDTLVCGDSGNDISLFAQMTKGVIVQNAQPELLSWYHQHRHPWHYLAQSAYARGIHEALDHFEFI
jgi:sucrose-6F-phosphate phosphohydrolase